MINDRIKHLRRRVADEFQAIPKGDTRFYLDNLITGVGFAFVIQPIFRDGKLGLGVEYTSLETKKYIHEIYWEDRIVTFENTLDICITHIKKEKEYRIKMKKELAINRKVGELKAIGINGIISSVFGDESDFELTQMGDHIRVSKKNQSGAIDISPAKDNTYRVILDWNINREQLEKFLTVMGDL